MAEAPTVQDFNAAIERAETSHDEKSRHRKVQVFRWQARTSALCLLARTLFLFYYVRINVKAQLAKSQPIMGRDSFAALTLLLVEITFTRESEAGKGKNALTNS